MRITDNLDLMSLFFSKEVLLFLEDNNRTKELKLVAPTAKDLYNTNYILAFNKWFAPLEEINKMTSQNFQSNYEVIKFIIFDLGKYIEYDLIYKSFLKTIDYIFPDSQIDYANKNIQVQGITITEEIWDYVIYVLKYCCGEKVEAPHQFQTKEEKDWFLAQKKAEERIKKIREQSKTETEQEKNNLLKVFLSIIYAFPSLTIDYLGNQTMAQIQWLQEYAAKSVSYKVNEKIFAAGNMKKGSKLEFFIK